MLSPSPSVISAHPFVRGSCVCVSLSLSLFVFLSFVLPALWQHSPLFKPEFALPSAASFAQVLGAATQLLRT
eukprot:m.73439 g.73439  ORF g.73439 m.73439 type:complete len:72 (-) comp8028_c1_seq2:57-272(-)